MRLGVMGPIGVGKSTFCEAFKQRFPEYTLVEEPVAQNPYLPYFYEHKKLFAFVSQNAFYSALFLEMWKTNDLENVIYDSTLFSNLVFAYQLFYEGYLTPAELAMTYAIAEKHLEHIKELTQYVVLRGSENWVMKNIYKRARSFELEQGQKEYLHQHYSSYYDIVDRLLDQNNVKNVTYVDLTEDIEPALIEGVYQDILQKTKGVS